MAPTVQAKRPPSWQDILGQIDQIRRIATALAERDQAPEPVRPELTLLPGGAR